MIPLNEHRFQLPVILPAGLFHCLRKHFCVLFRFISHRVSSARFALPAYAAELLMIASASRSGRRSRPVSARISVPGTAFLSGETISDDMPDPYALCLRDETVSDLQKSTQSIKKVSYPFGFQDAFFRPSKYYSFRKHDIIRTGDRTPEKSCCALAFHRKT